LIKLRPPASFRLNSNPYVLLIKHKNKIDARINSFFNLFLYVLTSYPEEVT